uniref:CUB domain-containing protein n=1 Tax=Cavia porcellus TaxID=10141 RepID=A0A286XF38_CAVPO
MGTCNLWTGHSLLCRVGGSVPIPQKFFGEVTSPLYPKPYPNNYETTTIITVPPGYRVKLVFQQFDLEPSEGCLYDYVKISADKKNLGRFCGQLGSPLGNPPGKKEFVSKGNKMLLTFHTDFSNEESGAIMFYKGFRAYYQAVVAPLIPISSWILWSTQTEVTSFTPGFRAGQVPAQESSGSFPPPAENIHKANFSPV